MTRYFDIEVTQGKRSRVTLLWELWTLLFIV